MSHVVTIHTQVRNPAAVAAACLRLGLPPPVQRKVPLFRATVEGLAVELPGWRYPVVCDLAGGNLQCDNYGGVWGDQKELDRFLQAYACEMTKIAARRQGHRVIEQPLADGSIKLIVQVTGGVA